MARYTKVDLVNDLLLHDAFADRSKKFVTEFVEDFFDSLALKVVAGDEVAIPGFGKFSKYQGTTDGKLNGKFRPKFSAFTEFRNAVSSN